MIFHLQKENYRDYASTFSKSVERQEDFEGKTQRKSKTRIGEDCDVYICIYFVYIFIYVYLFEILKLFRVSDKL